MGDDSVRVQRTFTAPPVAVGAADRDRPAVAHRIGDGEQDLGVRGVELAGLIRAGESLRGSVEPTGEVLGQHPPDLRRRRLVRRALRRRQPCSAAGDQAEQHGRRLVVAEHERGQTVPGGEPVPAVATAHRFHGHAGATGPCCSATPTATSSTSSPPSPQRPSRSSPADATHRCPPAKVVVGGDRSERASAPVARRHRRRGRRRQGAAVRGSGPIVRRSARPSAPSGRTTVRAEPCRGPRPAIPRRCRRGSAPRRPRGRPSWRRPASPSSRRR